MMKCNPSHWILPPGRDVVVLAVPRAVLKRAVSALVLRTKQDFKGGDPMSPGDWRSTSPT